ncbi:MAG: hypothetical protein DYG87_02525 [Anaerolineae bacterium CFX3]|jgi:hypothetical protein|nr:hypothetical protein [Anaerolineales bacterium]MCE7904657.1 hypothetical protein [Anaerolineae bacterium CFX3]MCQ3945687.1 hypothetical protein [Anaerolineae bacterium]GER78229.1 conserved hypothetical protein [Candidatus Denitrolinea symbiosum]MCZ2288530.1 hypothetical protein [Anaerolineales bacterium]
MSRVRFPVRAAAAGLILGLLACQPVFVIGWQEWLIMICAAALLVGPVVFRFLRMRPPRNGKRKRE